MRGLRLLVFLFQKLIEKTGDVIKDISCKTNSICAEGTYFKRTAEVNNISKNRNNIVLGKYTIIRGQLLTFKHGGYISIGDYCYVGEGTKIWSSSEVIIGNRVLISHNVNIHDNNAHPIDPVLRHNQYKKIISTGHPMEDYDLNEKPIIIKDDVWVGFNATILKGVTLGKGSIIGANSLVTKDVPDFTVVAGNPAQVIRNLDHS